MKALEEARALVAAYDLPEEVLTTLADGGYYWDGRFSNYVGDDGVSAQDLASSLSYQIGLDETRITDEYAVPLGTTKYRGLPHLPPDMEWPEGQFFAAQINLAELAKVDRSGRLPTSGMLYFFFNRRSESVVHWNGDPSLLEVRPYPPEETLPDAKYYLKEFLEDAKTLSLNPYWLFYFNDGDSTDYRRTKSLLPQDLIDGISEKLGCDIADWDDSGRLYGRPHYWQGEDEGFGMPVGYNENGQPLFADPKDETPKLMLMQDHFGEGNIYFWCEPEAAQKGDFSNVTMGYSGT